ncbi:MAG: hypothetical protein KKC84_06865, partial [Candidatus Omnitrophica bacterium]|nr:hypothetical protein [Candidatus Omnitrophota bacterium]
AKKAKLLKKSSCLFKKSCCDLVVANTSGGKSYTAYILKGPQQVVNTVQNKQELVSELIQYIGKNSKIE